MSKTKRNFACAINITTLVNSDCIFDVLGSLIIVLDKKGTVLLFNSGAEEITGYKSAEVIGHNWFETFLPAKIKEKLSIK